MILGTCSKFIQTYDCEETVHTSTLNLSCVASMCIFHILPTVHLIIFSFTIGYSKTWPNLMVKSMQTLVVRAYKCNTFSCLHCAPEADSPRPRVKILFSFRGYFLKKIAPVSYFTGTISGFTGAIL